MSPIILLRDEVTQNIKHFRDAAIHFHFRVVSFLRSFLRECIFKSRPFRNRVWLVNDNETVCVRTELCIRVYASKSKYGSFSIDLSFTNTFLMPTLQKYFQKVRIFTSSTTGSLCVNKSHFSTR